MLSEILSRLHTLEYDGFLAMGEKGSSSSCFGEYTPAPNTARDAWVYNFSSEELTATVSKSIAFYNREVSRWAASDRQMDVDQFVEYDESRMSWSRDLKNDLRKLNPAKFDEGKIRLALYRPYTRMSFFFDSIFNEEIYRANIQFPIARSEAENLSICCTSVGSEKPFLVLAANQLTNYHLTGAGSGTQCFSFYTYSEDGSNRRENITDWALDRFRSQYKDKSITKWDIFYYAYAVLHHPEYRTRYAANLKRELPRIPYAPEFHAFAKAGKRLAELHVEYEKQKEYPLERREKPGEKLDFRVDKMRLTNDKQTLVYNDFLTLTGIPKETYDYRLGNRSALEWVIDQCQVSTDKRSGITNDPNRNDKKYILRLIGQVITVSLETVKIVNALPDLGLPKEEKVKAK
jgi:predicted helicase